MTIVNNYKEYTIDGEVYFVEQYMEKYCSVWRWKYGYIDRHGYARTISDNLMSRPNIKKLFG